MVLYRLFARKQRINVTSGFMLFVPAFVIYTFQIKRLTVDSISLSSILPYSQNAVHSSLFRFERSRSSTAVCHCFLEVWQKYTPHFVILISSNYAATTGIKTLLKIPNRDFSVTLSNSAATTVIKTLLQI